MRGIIIGLTLALAASAPLAATAQAPVMTQPLAAGEVLLEVNALGFVTTRADRATLTFAVTGSGDTDTNARHGAQASIDSVRRVLQQQGVAAADIHVGPITTTADMVMADAMNDMMPDTNAMEAMENTGATMSAMTGSAQVDVTVRNVDRVAPIQAALNGLGIYVTGGVNYALNDDAGPRRQARAQALQKARADAEAYAVSLNMRVVRVVRVTERLGFDLFSLAGSESQLVGQIFSPTMMRGNGGEVPTIVAVGVDFALAPR
jgi:uncharacterized protein YggE